MTLFGLVELSQTPNRAVRGLVLSVFACPRACAQPGTAERIAKTKRPAAMKRLLTRIEVPPLKRTCEPGQHSLHVLFAKPGARTSRACGHSVRCSRHADCN